ncbi:MAG TPA: hypothetical protein VGD40_25355 [Chryseosolibacter sp.]
MSLFIFYFETAALISSLFAWPYLRKSRYLLLFPLILSLVVVVEAYVTFSWSFNAIIYNIQVPLQHLLYMLMIRFSLDTIRYRRVMTWVICIYALIAAYGFVFLTEKNHINTLAYCAGAIALIIGILTKFYEMLQNPSDYNFLRKPFFYLMFAYLLFNVGTLPYFAMGNWLYYTMKRPDILKILVNVMTVFNYILYSTYTFVFLWMVQKKAYY